MSNSPSPSCLKNNFFNFLKASVFITATAFAIGGFFVSTNTARAANEGDVIINEFVSNPLSGNEWVELFNNTEDPIDLDGWKIKELTTPNGTPNEVDWATLSGSIPAHGILVFEVSGNNLNNTSDSIGLYDDASTTIQRVTYGTVNDNYPVTDGLGTAPTSGKSGSFVGTTWSISDTPTKGWFNDAGQGGQNPPLLSEIATALSDNEIDSNIGELDNPSAATGLYFEKSDKGKIVFTYSLNLSDQATVAVLQSLGTAMDMSDGHISFDSETATAMSDTGATIYMYGLDFGSTPNIVVRNDDDEVIDGTDIVGNIAYTSGTGELSFTATHFTQFDVDYPVYIGTVGYESIQAAIDDASTTVPEIINVAAGTYNENLNISKPVTLQSTDDAENTIISGTGNVITINSNDVTINGFTITNEYTSGMGIYSVDHSNLTITNNIVTNIGNSSDDVVGRGIVIVSSGSNSINNITISDNQINNITSGKRTGTASVSSSGISVGWSTGTGDITNLVLDGNIISDINANTSPWNNSGTKGQGAYGIVINHASGKSGHTGSTVSPQITNNTISDMEGLWAHGIGLEGNTPNAVVTGNTISGIVDHKDGTDDVGVFFQDNSSGGTVTVSDNKFNGGDFLGVAIHLDDISAYNYTVDASQNWWGSVNPDFTSITSDNVDYTPWCEDDVCTTTRSINVSINDAETGFLTIQEAINAATSSDTINVAAGTYTEDITVDRSLTLKGPNAGINSRGVRGSEAIINGMVFFNGGASTSVTLDGFTINGPMEVDGAINPGVSNESNILNNIITSSLRGIWGQYLQFPATNLTIKGNEFDTDYGVAQTEDITGLVIENNVFKTDIEGIGIGEGAVIASLTGNQFLDTTMSVADYRILDTSAVNASNNYWGTAVESEIDAKISGSVNFTPWFVNAEMTILSSAVSGDTITGTDSNVSLGSGGTADLPSGITNLILSNNSNLDLSGGLSGDAVTLNSGTPGEDVVLTNSDLAGLSASIPDGTLITGPSGWDGLISPPKDAPSDGTSPAGFSVGDVVISIGSPDGTLTFDKAVKIVLTGVTGIVAYKPALSNIWQTIDTQCNSATNHDNINTDSPQECYFTVGGDTIIWTYHFTSFGGMDPNLVSNGGGYKRATPAIPAVPTLTPAIPAIPPGRVLGAAVFNFTLDLTLGNTGSEVIALQEMLVAQGHLQMPAGIAYGYFGPLTKAALIKWQLANGVSPAIGYWGKISKAKVNAQSGVVLDDSINAEIQQKIAEIRKELIVKMLQLVQLFQSQINTLQ